jgi:hypothetical protein
VRPDGFNNEKAVSKRVQRTASCAGFDPCDTTYMSPCGMLGNAGLTGGSSSPAAPDTIDKISRRQKEIIKYYVWREVL